jgi:c-di-GMP-binding flagellar brake protein YcgR
MTGDLRRHARTSIVMPIQYSAIVVNLRELKKIYKTAEIVDISNGGVGILTGYSLEKGHVLIFKKEIATNGRKAKVAVVRWVKKVEGEIDKYRAGLKFAAH